MARRRFQNGWVFRKGKNWILRYREDVREPNGNITRIQRSVVLGELRGKREAKNEAVKRLRGINSGTQQPQSVMTFGDFWGRHFIPEVVSKRKVSTQQMHHYLGAKHLLPHFGKYKLCDLEEADIQDFINLKQGHGYSTQTLRHFRNILSKFFRAAMRKKFIAANLTANLEMPAMKRVRQSRVLTLQEVSDLLRAFDHPLKTIFLFGLLTGLRIGEILGLRLQDLDLDGRLFYVRRNVYRGVVQEAPKTPAGDRFLPMASDLLESVQTWLRIRAEDSEWLFSNLAGKPQSDRNLRRRRLWPVCDRLGIPRFGWHSLRHTFSTYGGNSGVALPVLGYLLGHTDPKTTMIYTHPLLEPTRAAVEKIATILLPSAPHPGGNIRRRTVLIQ